jgi:hypothetical protein
MVSRPDMTECWRSRNRGQSERHEKEEALVEETSLGPRGGDHERAPGGFGEGAGAAG